MSSGITGKLVLAFVTLLLGAVLVGVVSTNVWGATSLSIAVDETNAFTANTTGTGINISEIHTVTYPPTGWKVADCPISSVTIQNASGTALTLTTDYALYAANGTFVFVDTAQTDGMIGAVNSTLVTYSYCGDDYINISWGRSITNLISGFFALAVLGTSIGLFYSIGKDTGII